MKIQIPLFNVDILLQSYGVLHLEYSTKHAQDITYI